MHWGLLPSALAAPLAAVVPVSVLVSGLLSSHAAALSAFLVRMPRSAAEVAQHAREQGWMQQAGWQEAHELYRQLLQQTALAHVCCPPALHRGRRYSLPERPPTLPSALQPSCLCSGSHAREEAAAAAAPPSRCSLCPSACCPSPQCLLPHAVSFYPQPLLLPSLPPLGDEDSTGLTGSQTARRPASAAAPAVSVDLSQDVDALLQLLDRPPAAASTQPEHAADAAACPQLLLSMAEHWRRWEQRALDGQQAEDEEEQDELQQAASSHWRQEEEEEAAARAEADELLLAGDDEDEDDDEQEAD